MFRVRGQDAAAVDRLGGVLGRARPRHSFRRPQPARQQNRQSHESSHDFRHGQFLQKWPRNFEQCDKWKLRAKSLAEAGLAKGIAKISISGRQVNQIGPSFGLIQEPEQATGVRRRGIRGLSLNCGRVA